MTVDLTEHRPIEGRKATGTHAVQDLPVWLWLWFPPAVLVLSAALRIYDGELHRQWIESEQGLVENMTALVLFPAVIYGLLAFRMRRALPVSWLGGWLLLLVAGAIYIAGEEISWGQQWFGWVTPSWFESVNDQGETNLHNTSSWLDQKPRLLFLLWVIVAGLVMPLLARLKGWSFDPATDWRYWFWPTPVVLFTAFLAAFIRVPEAVGDAIEALRAPLLVLRYAEYQEYFFALFLLLYLASFHVRLRQLAHR